MWRLVKEGLRIYRPVLLSAMATSTLGIAAIFAVLGLAGVTIDGRRALIWGVAALPVYTLCASAVAGWMTIGTELSEHRLRLHALLPMPLARVALAQLLLPASMLLLVGLPLAHATTALAQAVYGAGSLWLGHALLDLVAAHLLLLLQLTLVGREVIVLREAGRWQAALATLVPLLLVAAAVLNGLFIGRAVLLCAAAVTALAVLAALFAVTLFCRRSLITR